MAYTEKDVTELECYLRELHEIEDELSKIHSDKKLQAEMEKRGSNVREKVLELMLKKEHEAVLEAEQELAASDRELERLKSEKVQKDRMIATLERMKTEKTRQNGDK